eukprot:g5561.t1
MDDVGDEPAVVVSLLTHGAKPPPVQNAAQGEARERTLAELNEDGQSIHASENKLALVALKEDFASLRTAEKHIAELSPHDVADSLSTQLDRVAHRYNTHPQPCRNGKAALCLVRNFIALRYPSEDVALRILEALCQAAHQYGANKQTCDPVWLIVGLLDGGRVTPGDLKAVEEQRGTKDTSGLTLPGNFLAELEALRGARSWNIVEDGQRRLCLLSEADQKLLPNLYNKILDADAIDYATNRLRGLFASQIVQDARAALALKYGENYVAIDDHAGMPRELAEFLGQVYDIADRFTSTFLKADFMQKAFEPWVAPAKSHYSDERAERAGGDGEPSTKRQKS